MVLVEEGYGKNAVNGLVMQKASGKKNKRRVEGGGGVEEKEDTDRKEKPGIELHAIPQQEVKMFR